MKVSRAEIDPQALASRLMSARATREPIELLSQEYDLDQGIAYDIQDLLVSAICAASGDTLAGYKIAMTSPETMALAGASEPAFGVLVASTVVTSPAAVSLSDLYQPLIEGELVFIIDEDLTHAATEEEIVRKSRLAPAIEVPSARYRDWFGRIKVVDLVSDNTAAGLLVVGPDSVPASQLTLDAIGMRLRHDGREVTRGISAEVLGNPASAVAWLTRRLAERGKTLRAGSLVSSGTFTMPMRIHVGRYVADFDGIGSASVTFRP
jgi:2-keto-4-pentenoate hydratase